MNTIPLKNLLLFFNGNIKASDTRIFIQLKSSCSERLNVVMREGQAFDKRLLTSILPLPFPSLIDQRVVMSLERG